MQPGIDYTEVPPIPPPVTLQFVNAFLLNTTHFLNKFAWAAEEKLNKVSKTMRRLEITLSLLEAKLNSIEGINDGMPEAPASAAAPAAAEDGVPPPPPPPGSAPAPSADAGAAEAAAPAPSGMTVQQDPRYADYFKMLRVGVPLPNVQSKMMTLGIDPSILDNPDAPSDYDPAVHGSAAAAGGDDDSDMDDEEEDW